MQCLMILWYYLFCYEDAPINYSVLVGLPLTDRAGLIMSEHITWWYIPASDPTIAHAAHGRCKCIDMIDREACNLFVIRPALAWQDGHAVITDRQNYDNIFFM